MGKYPKVTKFLLIAMIMFLGLRTCYYGAPFRTCIYTEKEISLLPSMAKSKIYISRPTAIVRGIDYDYYCLAEMGRITNTLSQASEAKHYKYKNANRKIDYLDSDSSIELTPIKIISVTKHGLSTIDSGSGPIDHLILKDKAGELYEVATVSLGINKGDEFLKAVNGNKEILLDFDTKFFEER